MHYYSSNEQSHERSVSLELSAEITEEDRRKISALEWVVLYPSQRAEALWQTNALIRTFLALGKIQAARLAFNQVSDTFFKSNRAWKMSILLHLSLNLTFRAFICVFKRPHCFHDYNVY